MASGDKPTSFDIAALAGVSQPTVSRALRGDRTVSAATRLRIEAIARQLNYKVDKNASALRRGSTSTLALLFFEDPAPDGSRINPFFLSMLGSILKTCALRGYDLLTSFQQLSADWHKDYEDSRKADGLILLGYGDFDAYSRRLDQLVAQGTHFVRWGSADPAHPGTVIGCNNFAGGRDAGEHLIGGGRRSIAFLGDASSHYPESRDRYRGLAQALRMADMPVDPGLQVDALSSEASGYNAARRLIARGIAFDAIFAASDDMAAGALAAAHRRGVKVPDALAIAGFGDDPLAGYVWPPLTTMRQPVRDLAWNAADLLLSPEESVEQRELPHTLMVRGSTG